MTAWTGSFMALFGGLPRKATLTQIPRPRELGLRKVLFEDSQQARSQHPATLTDAWSAGGDHLAKGTPLIHDAPRVPRFREALRRLGPRA